jgi:hypothetical protein
MMMHSLVWIITQLCHHMQLLFILMIFVRMLACWKRVRLHSQLAHHQDHHAHLETLNRPLMSDAGMRMITSMHPQSLSVTRGLLCPPEGPWSTLTPTLTGRYSICPHVSPFPTDALMCLCLSRMVSCLSCFGVPVCFSEHVCPMRSMCACV